MKDFFKKLMSDDTDINQFTKYEIIVYGILLPLGFVLIMGLAGWMETCCNKI